MATGFKLRKEKSEIAVSEFEAWCGQRGIQYAKTGYETLIASSGFLDAIKSCNDYTSVTQKFWPDYICVNNESCLVEVKYGKFIQREAYESYMDQYSVGQNVGIVFLYQRSLLFCKIQDLKLKKLRFYDVPIEDHVWNCPRKLPKDEYAKWKIKNPFSSGTDYGRVDFDKTDFKKLTDISKDAAEQLRNIDSSSKVQQRA